MVLSMMAMPAAPPGPPKTFTFRRRHRLAHARQFQAVYGGRVRKVRGPLTVFALPNGMEHPRLGLSVGRRCGTAVMRNRIKRGVREAFRFAQHELPVIEQGAGLGVSVGSYDFVVSAAPHEPLTAEDYGRAFVAAAAELHREWIKRLKRAQT